MTTRVVQTFADAEAVSQAAAREFVRCGAAASAARGRFTVTLSGGSTPQRLFQLLADKPYRGQVDWKQVEVFWGDERCVPPDHKDSNYRMAREAMLDRLPIPPGHIHRLEGERADHASAARDYQAVIARLFGVAPGGEPPPFDLALLGMGPDGHTASLFPETTALNETSQWVVVNYVPKFATDRLTLTAPILNRAHEVLFLVCGSDKTDRLVEVLEGPFEPARLPSQLIRPAAGQLIWYVDRLAAAKLTTSLTGPGHDGGNP
jgi:6-phosphogluconolactonase